ncbi:MAG: hypothetical protein V7K27_06325 [Nostoc sp.]|uniref:hypothetical protein n=1 Tax=Nostoc sp. TaxID=1180 RepID=UPI002FFBFB82
MVEKTVTLWCKSQTFTNMRSRREHIGNENRNYYAADKFCLSLVSPLMRNPSDNHLQGANF